MWPSVQEFPSLMIPRCDLKALFRLFFFPCSFDYNQQQNELRHFAVNWAFLRFTDFKRRKYSSPIPSMQCCAHIRATYRKRQTPQLWMEGAGEGYGLFCCLKLPYLNEYDVSTILSPVVALNTCKTWWSTDGGKMSARSTSGFLVR